MKKIISVLLTLTILTCALACSFSAFALTGKEAAPELTLGNSMSVTVGTTGENEEDGVFIAKFTPAEDGWYEFIFDTAYTSTAPAADETANVCLTIRDGDDTWTGNALALDLSIFSAEEIEQMRQSGAVDVDHANLIACTAYLEAGTTYYLNLTNTGLDAYTSNLVVNKHTHTIVTREVTGDEDLPDGKYESCSDWYCSYDEMVEAYKVTYEVTEGAGQVIGRGEDLVITVNGSLNKFYDIYIDDEALTRGDDFTVEAGSTIATIKAEYLDTLEAGKHTVKFTYTDGEATTDFTIEGEANTTGVADTAKTSPDTGEHADVFFAGTLMLSAAAVVIFVAFKKKELEK